MNMEKWAKTREKAGVVFGHLMWDKSEKAYEKETGKAL